MEKRNEIRSSLENNTVPKSYSEETCLKRVYDERKTEVSETPRSNSDKEETILTRAGVCKTLCPQLPDSNTV